MTTQEDRPQWPDCHGLRVHQERGFAPQTVPPLLVVRDMLPTCLCCGAVATLFSLDENRLAFDCGATLEWITDIPDEESEWWFVKDGCRRHTQAQVGEPS